MCFQFNLFKRENNKLKEIAFSKGEIEDILEYSYRKTVKGSILEDSKILRSFFRKILKWKIKLLQKYLIFYYIQNEIDMIIIWNGLQYHAYTAAKTAEKMDIKSVFMENGYFPNTLVMDPAGVNYYNSLVVKERQFYQNIEVDNNKLSELKNRGIKKVKLRKQIRNDGKGFDLPDKYIFLPFQVHDDTQIIIHSHFINNMRKFLIEVLSVIKKIDKNYWLIAKEHPKDIGRVNYDYLRNKFKKDNVKILKKGDTGKLIQNSEVVITVNSTVGIEALLYHKAVVTLGEAFYNVKGLVYHVNTVDELYFKVKEALTKDVNKEFIDKFIYFLRYNYLVEADKKNRSAGSNKEVIERLKDIVGGGHHLFTI